MAKDILLFLDGTRNRSSHRWDGLATNVWKVFDAVASKNLPGGPDARYVRGIASTGAPPPLSDLDASLPAKAKWPTALGRAVRDLVMAGRYVPNQFESATGWGMALQIQRAYSYLCQHYAYGDRVSIFGFSRGAFAARSLAGFVDQVGLLLRTAARGKHRRYLVTLAYELYRTGQYEKWLELRSFLTQMVGSSIPRPGTEGQQSTILPIYFVGVWDTVDALGFEALGKDNANIPIVRNHTGHHVAQDVPSNVTHARHALSLHELRKAFEPVLWNGCGSGQVLKQVWFAGAHADVGGGYADSGHSVHVLGWMVSEFQAALRESHSPLQLNGLVPPAGNSPTLPPHHEIQGYFRDDEPTVRTALSQFRALPPSTLATLSVHRSATMRLLEPLKAIDYGPYPYETSAPRMSVFPDKVWQALLKVDDLTVRLHIACVQASSTSTAGTHVASEGAAGLAAIPANWASARYQVAIRNASALVRRRLPTMRWDAVDEAKLADAVVLLAVFNRADVVEIALRRIRHKALGWERLARNPRYRRRRLWPFARRRRNALEALMARTMALVPAGYSLGAASVEDTLATVSRASSQFPAVPKPVKPIRLQRE